jgi:Mysoin-binding motif of peroxisomes
MLQSTIKTGITKGEHARFLEQFRYLIIASQLLVEQSRPVRRKTNRALPEVDHVFQSQQRSDSDVLTIHGVLATAVSSFLIAWAFHWVRSSTTHSARTLSTEILAVLVLIVALVVGFRSYTWRNRSQRLRRNVIDAVSSLVAQSHTLDGLTSTALTLIQEIEVVARGYEMYVPYPACSQ